MQIKPLNSAISNALYGIDRGMAGLRESAAEIASADRLNGDAPADVTGPLVEAMLYRLQVEASAKVLSRVDTALGSLLDKLA